MFSEKQLQLLLDAQSGDDWTLEYFKERIFIMRKGSGISTTEFDDLINWVQSLSLEQVYTLQIALMGFLDLKLFKNNNVTT